MRKGSGHSEGTSESRCIGCLSKENIIIEHEDRMVGSNSIQHQCERYIKIFSTRRWLYTQHEFALQIQIQTPSPKTQPSLHPIKSPHNSTPCITQTSPPFPPPHYPLFKSSQPVKILITFPLSQQTIFYLQPSTFPLRPLLLPPPWNCVPDMVRGSRIKGNGKMSTSKHDQGKVVYRCKWEYERGLQLLS